MPTRVCHGPRGQSLSLRLKAHAAKACSWCTPVRPHGIGSYMMIHSETPAAAQKPLVCKWTCTQPQAFLPRTANPRNEQTKCLTAPLTGLPEWRGGSARLQVLITLSFDRFTRRPLTWAAWRPEAANALPTWKRRRHTIFLATQPVPFAAEGWAAASLLVPSLQVGADALISWQRPQEYHSQLRPRNLRSC